MQKGWTRFELAQLLEKILHNKAEDKWKELLPPALQKLFLHKRKEEIGVTMSNIVWLGNQLECGSYSEPALKNWVKREIKEFIGSPVIGRKYSVQQAAILFIVKDLKVLLDFEAIRKVLGSIFNNPVDRTDDIISPVHFYKAYACLYEKIISQMEIFSEEHVKNEIEMYLDELSSFTKDEKKQIMKSLMIAVLAVRTTYLKALAKQYVDH